MDLLDLSRGTITPRRTAVLIRHLPAGAALWRETGGDLFWSDEVAATLNGAWRVTCAVLQAAGAKPRDLPPAPKPPEPGWREREQATVEDRAARRRRKAENWIRRYGAAAGITTGH